MTAGPAATEGVVAAQRQELVEEVVEDGEVVAAISRFRSGGARAGPAYLPTYCEDFRG